METRSNICITLPPTFVAGFHDDFIIKKMKYRKLGKTNMITSRLAVGGASYGNLLSAEYADLAKEVLRLSLKGGVNFFETSPCYGEGESEKIIGEALKGITRQAYYIGTRVGRYSASFEKMFDYSAKKIRESVKESLERLQVNYIDLVTIQDIEFCPDVETILKQTLPALEALKKNRIIRNIGISSYSLSKLKELIDLAGPTRIDVIISNTRLTFFDKALLDFVPYFLEKEIGIIAGDIDGKGLITNSGLTEFHPASKELKNKILEGTKKCNEVGAEINKLATFHVAQCSEVDVCIVDLLTPFELKSQYDAVLNLLRPNELIIYKYLKEDLFKINVVYNWEEVEVKLYNSWLEQQKGNAETKEQS